MPRQVVSGNGSVLLGKNSVATSLPELVQSCRARQLCRELGCSLRRALDPLAEHGAQHLEMRFPGHRTELTHTLQLRGAALGRGLREVENSTVPCDGIPGRKEQRKILCRLPQS